jgi:membrane peptidoglycan carboxypeptidase
MAAFWTLVLALQAAGRFAQRIVVGIADAGARAWTATGRTIHSLSQRRVARHRSRPRRTHRAAPGPAHPARPRRPRAVSGAPVRHGRSAGSRSTSRQRPGPESGAFPDDRPVARPRLAVLGVALAIVVAGAAFLFGPVLHLVARPLASSLANKGLPPLEERSAVLAADASTLAVLHDGINRRVVSLDEVPEVMRHAVLAAEDKDFWDHRGYDLTAMVRAMRANLQAREVTQGGSTISQQVAKQNFVGGEKSVVRKAKEVLYAVALEQRLAKEQMFERYLNQVYFGSQAYGVAAAADEFFGIDIKDVSLEQAALLAGVIRAPAALDPRTDPESATARRNQVLRAMANEGFISGEAASEASARPIEVLPARPAQVSDPFVVEAAKREFLTNPAFGETVEERQRLLLAGGLQIETTVDPSLQEAAKTALGYVSDDLGSALVAVDPRSGAVLAVHDSGLAGEGHFDVATQGQRGPGSTFKPLAAAAALEAGMPQSQFLVGDGPIELTYRGAPGPWGVENFAEADHGPVLLADAVINSVNTAFAQIGVALGPDKIADVARRMGIDVDRAMGPPEARGPAVALGGLRHGVSPLEMASAYATFASGGSRIPPYVIARVVGPDGQELYKAQPAPQPVLDRAVNGILVEILQEAVAEGTGVRASLPGWVPLGKTGTSEEGADAWFVGAVPVLSAAVWVGNPTSTEPIPGLTGGQVAAPVWREFMRAALRGTAPVNFPPRTADRPVIRPLDLPTARPCTTACTKPPVA